MTTYEQDLKELNITSEEFDNIISNIYDKTADEMVTLAKAIKSGARVLPAVKRAFERVLDMRPEERKEARTTNSRTSSGSVMPAWTVPTP